MKLVVTEKSADEFASFLLSIIVSLGRTDTVLEVIFGKDSD